MEFESNTPPSDREIALADAPRLSIQPVHIDRLPEATSIDRSRRNDRTFEFERETTTETAIQSSHPHHRTAIIAGVACAVLFCSVIMLLYLAQ